MTALHHRQKKELVDTIAALQQSYADTRAEAAASYRLMVGDGGGGAGGGGGGKKGGEEALLWLPGRASYRCAAPACSPTSPTHPPVAAYPATHLC